MPGDDKGLTIMTSAGSTPTQPPPRSTVRDGFGEDAQVFRPPTPDELDEILRLKYGDIDSCGWGPRLRRRIGYYTPDEVYEAVVARLVVEGCAWADVGCGRDVFPDNHRLARTLAGRCGLLVGIDPDDNLDENPNLHRRVKSTIDAFVGDQAFDVVTLRMVAEHITEPAAAVASLARLTRPGGVVVVYTVDRYSPAAIAARIVPFRLHHAVKRSLWGTEERDTFPVAYRMNTRRELARIFAAGGFEEVWYRRLADCRVFGRFRSLHRLELLAWEVSKSLGLEYPENCIISVFSKNLRS